MADIEIGWIGMGRMGFPMAERLLKAGYSLKVWNRTRSKAEPLEKAGAVLVDSPADLSGVDILATMVSTGRDAEELYFGEVGVLSGGGVPKIFLDFSSIGVDQSAEIRSRLLEVGAQLVCCPVSGNGKCVKAGK